jgi:excisionase family DNA binding protein
MEVASELRNGTAGHHEIARLAQRLADVSRRLDELDSAQTELFWQVRDLHARLAEMAPSLTQLERQIGEISTLLSVAKPDMTNVGNLQDPTDGWISVKEAARFLGVSPDTVRRYIARGFLKARRLPTGRGWRLLRSEVKQVLSTASDGRAGFRSPEDPLAEKIEEGRA